MPILKPGGLLQDENRELALWFSSRGVTKERRMSKFVSEWGKQHRDLTWPEGMPEDLQARLFRLRRMVLIYAYLLFGIGEETITPRLWSRMCNELQMIQAAWGHEFNFYDYLFEGWDQTREDHLFTNRGIDSGIVNHAMRILAVRKASQRKLILEEDVPY